MSFPTQRLWHSLPNQKWPLLKLSASCDYLAISWNYPLQCFSLAWCISCVQFFNFQSSSVTAGRTPPLHSPGWINHFPNGKSLLPIAFRLCNHSFLKFHSVMFRRTPISRTARLAISLPIFSHAIWWSGPLWLHHPPESCPPMFFSNNVQSLRYVLCIPCPIGISRCVIL